MRFVIVGGGIAGVTAAQTLIKELPDSEVDIFTEELLPLYYRPRLIEYLAGEATLQSLVVYPEEWYRNLGIRLHLGQGIAEIDVPGSRVTTAKGERVSYDALLLATGARPYMGTGHAAGEGRGLGHGRASPSVPGKCQVASAEGGGHRLGLHGGN